MKTVIANSQLHGPYERQEDQETEMAYYVQWSQEAMDGASIDPEDT